MLEGIERVSKTKTIYEDIKLKIINHELKQGARLVERTLCEHYNSSRTPIREALRMLSNEGLVVFRTGSTVYVSTITYELINELYDIREVLEGLSARLCAQNISSSNLELLEVMVEKFKSLMVEKEYKKALTQDIEIHDFMISQSRNKHLSEMLLPVSNQSKRVVTITTYTDKWAEETLNHHLQVFEAIKTRNGDLAESIMREHIRNSKRHQLEHLNTYRFQNR